VSKRDEQFVKDIVLFIRKYVVTSPEERLALALWVIHTHLIEWAQATPYLSITSAEKRSGKTRLLELLEMLCARAWRVVQLSPAVTYRRISSEDPPPTLLFDETDALWNPKTAHNHEDLRGLINAGHRRGSKVYRCVGPTSKVAEFNTFCAKALCGIGTLPSTITDRSVPVRLRRKRPHEEAEDFEYEDVLPVGEALRDRVAAWAHSHGEAVGEARPAMPKALNDRAREGCKPLVAIADELGIGAVARKALVKLYAGERLDDTESMRIRLLRDIRDVFGDQRRRMSTEELLDGLHRIEEGGWDKYYGRPLEPRDLSTLLSHYGIGPVNVKVHGETLRGYKREHLWDSWVRYLS
jgi:hypothetical protein